MSAQDDLVARVRAHFGDRVEREVPMFGGIAFMVDDRLVASAGRRGDLLVRVLAARHEDYLSREGAEQATMAQGRRTMGPGWVTVSPEALVEAADLAWWLDAAVAH